MINTSINNTSPKLLLDQKRNRIIDTEMDDLESKKTPLSTTNRPIPRYSFFPQTSQKRMSIDLDDDMSYSNLIPNNHIGCNCKNSQCLKRYCECFTRMKFCNPNVCTCKNCYNTIENEKERNEAIQNYMQRSPISFKKINMTESQLFCSCKKSFCLKKYCECFQVGMKCTSNCKCIDCQNKSGERKLFAVSGGGEKRERFYSDSNMINKQRLEYKTVLVEPKQIIIDNYDFKGHIHEEGMFLNSNKNSNELTHESNNFSLNGGQKEKQSSFNNGNNIQLQYNQNGFFN